MEEKDKIILIHDLEQEKEDLKIKINNLRFFLDFPRKEHIGEEMRWAMEGQFRSMMAYHAYLLERIQLLKGRPEEGVSSIYE